MMDLSQLQTTTHQQQKELWEKEHQDPQVLASMDSPGPSSGVELFWDWVKGKINPRSSEGLEICCGKGRNCIFLANKGVKMFAYDFSRTAVETAREKTAGLGLENISFIVHDATKKLPYKNNKFNFVVDCFGSNDIETEEGRKFARDEVIRVLKPGGYLFLYTLSTDDEFFQEMIQKFPSREKNTFLHPENGKFEKTWDLKELLEFYQGLRRVESRRIEKKARLYGKEYNNKYFWLVFQKV